MQRKSKNGFNKNNQDAKLDEIQHGEDNTETKPPYQVNLALMSEEVNSHDLISFEEAREREKWIEMQWKQTMRLWWKTRLGSLVELPLDKKSIGCKWVYRRKFKEDGWVDKYKIKFVAKGYAQHEGRDLKWLWDFCSHNKVDHNKIAFSHGSPAPQTDTKSVFLNGDMEE